MTDSKPIVFDLFCGLGGWSEAFITEGWRAIGFDIEKHDYGHGTYPGELVLRDIRSLTGAELVATYGVPAVIVASPPCQEFSYMAMPWSKAKQKAAKIKSDPAERVRLTDLFNQCFRIQREVSQAAGRYVPMLIENVRGAQPWVGKARWNFGSFYLWGDVPALMPIPSKAVLKCKSNDPRRGTKSAWITEPLTHMAGNQAGLKLPGNNSQKRWEDRPVKRLKDALDEESGRKGIPHRTTSYWTNPAEHEGRKQPGISGLRNNGKGDSWFQDGAAHHGSKSLKRKEASAMIAKIPPPLAQWIARCFKPK